MNFTFFCKVKYCRGQYKIIDEGLKGLQRTLSAEAVLVIKPLRALNTLRAKPAFAKATAGEGGERGIRTLGTGFPVRQFSKLFLSASQASLRS
jgi:hypothetical protein